MIYTYEQLKGIIKVGDKVRADNAMSNGCYQLNNGKVGIITGVSDEEFCINGCDHSYGGNASLEIIEDRIPTLDTLEVGDVIGDEFNEDENEIIIFVSGELIFSKNKDGEADGPFTKEELKKLEFVIKTPSGGTISLAKIRTLWNAIYDEKPLEIVELTIPQIAQKFNLKDEQVRIKE